MTIIEGDRFRHKIDGRFYKMKKFKNGAFVLESEDDPIRTWVGDGDLDLFFEAIEEKEGQ